MPNFDDIIGQEHIKEHLRNAVMTGRVSHAYMIEGERYSGKEYIAGIFAAALLCEAGEGQPCGKCPACLKSFSDNNPDIIKVTHAKPNVIGVEDVREQINGDIHIRPYSGKKKIYIVNEAEKMNPQAQNAILKTFEEPPEYAVILLLTVSSEELLQTIRSRAVQLSMKPVSDALIRKYLMEQEGVPDYKADICTAFARGNLGKARLLAGNEDFDSVRREITGLLRTIDKTEVTDVSAAVKRASAYKAEINDYFDIMLAWYRDALMFKAARDVNGLIFKEEIQYIMKVADRCSYEDIEEIILGIDKARRRISANVNFDLTMELLFLLIQEKMS